MPTYLVHGFRWPRPLIRIHIILQNLDDAAAEWLMASATTRALLENFKTLHPQIMAHLSDLKFVEQYDPTDESADNKSQPYAYVADVVHEVKLGLEIDEVRGKGVSNERWASMVDLRDAIAPGEKVAWFVVVCGDTERWAPPTVQLLENGGSLLARSGANGVDQGILSGKQAQSEQDESLQSKKSRSKFSKLFGRGDKTAHNTQSNKTSFRPQSSPKSVSHSQNTQTQPPLPQIQTVQASHQQNSSVPTVSSPTSLPRSSTSTAVFQNPNGRSTARATPTPPRTTILSSALGAGPAIIQPSALPPSVELAPVSQLVTSSTQTLNPVQEVNRAVRNEAPGKKPAQSASHSRSHSHTLSQQSASPSVSVFSDAGMVSHSASLVMPGPVQSFKAQSATLPMRPMSSNPGQMLAPHHQALAAATAAANASKVPAKTYFQSVNPNAMGSRFQQSNSHPQSQSQSQSASPTIVQSSLLPPSTAPPTRDLPVPPGDELGLGGVGLAGREVPIRPGMAGGLVDGGKVMMI